MHCLTVSHSTHCRYSSIEQALLLGWSTAVKKGTTADELQAWQMAPYCEAVLQQGSSQYMLQVRRWLANLQRT